MCVCVCTYLCSVVDWYMAQALTESYIRYEVNTMTIFDETFICQVGERNQYLGPWLEFLGLRKMS